VEHRVTQAQPPLPQFISIPSTPFLMGTPERQLSALAKAHGGTRESYREESPQRQVTLPPFQIARTPVTNALYAAYVAASGARPPLSWRAAQPPASLGDHPVTDVSWHEAQSFCAWLTHTLEQLGGHDPLALSGRRARFCLPSDAQWELAARGTDGRMFPWGDEWDQARANTREAGIGATRPAGSFPLGASPYGCVDVAGTVWEWTSSLDRPYPYEPQDGREDAGGAGRRILRGGCYANPHGYARCACRFRLPPAVSNEFLGFRLAIVQ
jgi:formylglycine-generating enzyme required for sulfatase activity